MGIMTAPGVQVRAAAAGAGENCVGYLLGFEHLTFYANGPVGWVEEIMVRPEQRGGGVGRALMAGFEQWAAYLRKVLLVT
jgi:GNAT superfamily N-acetyltransferase